MRAQVEPTLVDNIMPKDHWRANALSSSEHLPICMAPSMCFDEHRLLSKHLASVPGNTVFEVGCAPGKWLAYFALFFGLKPSGIEYVAEGATVTRQNLAMQGLDGEVIHGDFFHTELPRSHYDVVFSRGFIEHIPNTQDCVDRIACLAKRGGYVITTAPNMSGINGLLRKKFLPESYAAHLKLVPEGVRVLHERAGVRTLFCDYGGVPCLILPHDVRSRPIGPETLCERVLDLFKRALNRAVRKTCTRSRWVPRWRWFSPTIIYVGVKA